MQLLNKIAGPSPRRATGRAPSLRALRLSVTVFFALDGFLFASWAVRVPAVKAQVGASPAALGLALLGLSAGSIATMAITGALCRRLGSRQVTVTAGAALSLALVLPTFARSALTLGLALAVLGVAYGGLNVAMNSVAVDIVAALRRPVMPSFHAAWSFGGLGGASLGGLIAPHLAPRPALALMAAAGLAVTATCGRLLCPPGGLRRPFDPLQGGDPPVTPLPGGTRHNPPGPRALPPTGLGATPPTPGLPTYRAGEDPQSALPPTGPDTRPLSTPHARRHLWRVVVLFGLIGACAAYGEGAVADWGALHLREDLGASAGLAAAGYAAFAIAEACGRLAGTSLLARLGQTRVLAGGGIVASAGMLAAALAPDLPVALAGFALTGLGVANMFPAAMAQAGLATGPRGVAAASTLGYAGFLLGPPTIGLLAGSVGLPAGLTTVSALALAASALALLARLPFLNIVTTP